MSSFTLLRTLSNTESGVVTRHTPWSKLKNAVAPKWPHQFRARVVPYLKNCAYQLGEYLGIKNDPEERTERMRKEEQIRALNNYHKRKLKEEKKRNKNLKQYRKMQPTERARNSEA